jgi:hypothetical protein
LAEGNAVELEGATPDEGHARQARRAAFHW